MAARFADPRRFAAWLSAGWLLGCAGAPSPSSPSAPAAPVPSRATASPAEVAPLPPLPPPPLPIAGVPASVAERVDRLVARVVAGASVHAVEQAIGAIAEYGERSAPSIERGLPAASSRARAALLDVLALVGAPGCGVRATAWLADGDWRVREAAARVCARHRTPGARAGLVRLLRDPVGRVREAAAAACGALRDPAVTPALAALAAGPPGPAHEAALAALVRTPGHAAVVALAATVGETDAAVSAAAVRALGARAVAAVPASRSALVAVVDTARESVRRPALVGLARIGTTGPAGPPAVQRAIAREVAAAMQPQSSAALPGPDGVETLRALGAPVLATLAARVAVVARPTLKEICLRLQRIPGMGSTAALRAAAARDDCPPFVVQELGRRQDAASVPLLVRHAQGASDLAPASIQALADIGGASAVQALTPLLSHERARTRGDAAGALAEAGGAQVVPLLVDRLRRGTEQDAFARWLVLQALALVDGAAGAAHARRLVRTDPSPRVREGAAAVVGRYGRAPADGALLATVASEDSEADVRYTALQHARAAGASLELLLPCLNDSVYLVRALALREAGPALPVAALRTRARPPGADGATGESDESIRAAAVTVSAARALAGEPLAGIVERALADPDEEVRIAAVHGLTLSHRRADAVRLAGPMLQDESEAVRVAAMRVLAAAGAPAGRAAAVIAVASGDHGRRLEAADALQASADPEAAVAIQARLAAEPGPERQERLHLLRVLVELEVSAGAPLLAAQAESLGLKQRGLRRGRDTARRDRSEARAFRLYCYRALAAIGTPVALTALRQAAEAAEQHVAAPALVALAGRALRADEALAAAGAARTALELDPRSAEAWVAVWRAARQGALPMPVPGQHAPHPLAIAAVMHRLGLDAAAAAVLGHPAVAARRDPEIAWQRSILLDWLARFDDANAARAEAVRWAGGAGGTGAAERTAPGAAVLRRRALRALARGDGVAARRAAVAALVRAAEPSGTADEWIAPLAQVLTATEPPALADRCWLAAARAALTTSRLRLDLVDGRLFHIAAAAARRTGDPGAARFAAIARRRAAVR